MTISSIKKDAKHILKELKGKYLLFSIPFLMQAILFSLQMRESYLTQQGIEVSFAATLFPLLWRFLSSVCLLSATYTMISVIRHKKQAVSARDNGLAFSSDYFFKILSLTLIRFLLILLWSLLLIVGTIITTIGFMALYSNYQAGSNMLVSALMTLVGLVIAIIGLYLSINRSLAYAMADYILYDDINDNNYSGALDCIEKSKVMMQGNKWKFFLLQLSFIGWFILSLLSFGILYLYLLPYFTTSMVYFYEKIKGDVNERDSINRKPLLSSSIDPSLMED